jgi:hypothetical protein
MAPNGLQMGTVQPMARVFRLSDFQAKKRRFVYFNRIELNQLLAVYSRRIIAGEWKAYAIDHGDGAALFSVFLHANAQPLYTIVKLAEGSRRQGDWLIVSGGRKLRQSATLGEALKLFDRQLRLVSP